MKIFTLGVGDKAVQDLEQTTKINEVNESDVNLQILKELTLIRLILAESFGIEIDKGDLNE